jgi:hypothetical protein
MANSIQLQWGWAVLVLGAGLLIYAGWAARRGGEGSGGGGEGAPPPT